MSKIKIVLNDRLYQMHWHFVWWPMRFTDGTRVWLRFIERQWVRGGIFGEDGWQWRYGRIWPRFL